MPIDLNELERLIAEATKLPWSVEVETDASIDDEAEEGLSISIREIHRLLHDHEWADAEDWDRDMANADLIAAAVNALPDLICEMRELRADKERLVKAAGEVLYRIKGDPRMEGGAYYRIAPATHPDTHKAIIGLQAAIDAACVHETRTDDESEREVRSDRRTTTSRP